MNTNLIYITNIPKSQRPILLLKELNNKWSKMVYIDNPYSELVDAFIYNLTPTVAHFDKGIEKLRRKEIDGGTPLQVYYVWFPPPNVFMLSLIPEGSIMLPYILVDSLPKDIEVHDVIGDLPFKANDVKEWDIPQKDDKWIVIRLPLSHDETTRNYVLSYLRNKRLPKGMFPRVTEMFVSEEPHLSRFMVPKTMRVLSISSSYKSNLLFTYDLPTRLTGHHIVDALKDLEYRHCKAYLIDITDQLRLGFISVSKSLPDYKFNELVQKMKTMEIDVSNLGKVKLNISEVWLQPVNCDPPTPKKLDSGKNVEFILINYLYLHNLSATVQPPDLNVKSPVPFRVHIYHSQDSNTQIGFVSLQDIHDTQVPVLMAYLRSLVFDGLSVFVDDMWIKEYDLPEPSKRKAVHKSRELVLHTPVIHNQVIKCSDMDPVIDDLGLGGEVIIKLAEEPPTSSNLMKSHMIFLMNLPPNLNKSKIIFDMSVPCEGLCLMQTTTEKVAFLYHRQVSDVKWLEMLNKICSTTIGDRRVVAKEIYLMSDETIDLIQSKYPAVYLSSYVFVYNIGLESAAPEGSSAGAGGAGGTDELNQHPYIIRHCFMTTDSNTKCAFVQLRDDLTPPQIIEVLNHIRTISIGGKIVWADLMWLANIAVIDNRAALPAASTRSLQLCGDPRLLWMKEPPEKRFKD